jgi:23S rRNA A1618 N6-methylase RlmF
VNKTFRLNVKLVKEVETVCIQRDISMNNRGYCVAICNGVFGERSGIKSQTKKPHRKREKATGAVEKRVLQQSPAR